MKYLPGKCTTNSIIQVNYHTYIAKHLYNRRDLLRSLSHLTSKVNINIVYITFFHDN